MAKLLDVNYATGTGVTNILVDITYPEYKVIWLGSQVNQLNDRSYSFATQFRLYYRITDPITALSFPNPTVSISRNIGQAASSQPI